MDTSEENPFENEAVANEWIESVEAERNSFRDREIYPYLSAWVEKVDPAIVVEIGSGQGICSEKINLEKRSYIGIEPSRILHERAMRKYGSPKKMFLLGNGYCTSLPNHISDAAFSVNVLFHMEDLERSSKELARILEPKGAFLIITANPDSYNEWRKLYSIISEDEKKIIGNFQVPGRLLSKSIFYKHSLDVIKKSFSDNDLILEIAEVLGRRGEKGSGLFTAFSGRKGGGLS